MRILVTNDDGAHAPGLWALVRAVRPLGEIVVSAPDRDRSGVGPALSVNDMIRAKEVTPEIEGVRTFAVEGTPGDAAVLGLRKLVGEPVDLVVSGINPGTNVGEDVVISGTVGAGLHAFLNGVSTVAISVDGDSDPSHPAVQSVTRAIVAEVARARGFPWFVNVNFPGERPRGARRTRVATRLLEDTIDTVQRGHRTYYWLLRRGGRSADSAAPDTDVAAVRRGYLSISALYPEFTEGDVTSRLDALVRAAEGALEGGG